jgi:iron complex transport system substrate-binding protein
VSGLALAACGGGAEAEPAPQAASTQAESAVIAEEAPGFPREVEHALGTTVIPEEPTRIVTVGVTEQDALLALGIAPVGVTEWYGEQPYATWPWAQDELGDAQPAVLTTVDGFDFEQIAALDPDLIVGTNAGLDEKSYELLSEIAPTIAHPVDSEPYFSAWADQAELIAQAVGKEAEMAVIVDGIRQRFAEAAAAHPEFDGTSIVFLQNAFYSGEAIAYQNGLSTEFLTDLGFTIPEEIDAFVKEGEQAHIPLERLSVLDAADVLLWATERPADRAALEDEPIYRTLEEVEAGRLVFTDGVTAGAIYFTSVLSLPYVLDQLVPALESTLAGDGPAVIEAT